MALNINNYLSRALYIFFCGRNRVFIADPNIFEEMRIRYCRVITTEKSNR